MKHEASYDVIFRYFSVPEQNYREILGVVEPIFYNIPDGYTFEKGSNSIPMVVVSDSNIARALNELDQAIRRPGQTLMHCRIAMEACMQSFRIGSNRQEAWAALSKNLSVRSETITELMQISHKQRHGELVKTTWKQRQIAMQIAWEIVNRLILFRINEINNRSEINFTLI